jgi:hypothetical protein
MSKWQRLLLGWTVVALGAAEYVRHLRLSDRAQVVIGATEVLLAVATGIAFGIATISKHKERL